MNKGYEILFEDGRRIVKGLGHYPASYVTDCRGLVKGTVKKYGNKTAFKFKRNGKTVEISYKAFDNHIDALGTALHSLGLKDNKIAIIGENRYEWAVAYFSVINGTGVGVPLDKYLPAIEIENLVNRSGATAIFYSQAFHDVMVGISKKENSLKYFISMDNQNDDSENTRFLNMQSLIDKGRELLDKGDKSFVDAQINRETLSILLFTSGTTKAAKGVMLSHKNVASNVTALTGCIEIFPTDVHLSLLPLHHTFESTLGMLFMLHAGVTIAYSEGIRHIAQELKDFNVSILVAVPAIFEALYSKLISGIEKAGKLGLVNFLKKVTGLLLKLGIDTRKKVFKSILDKLGPSLRLFVSGAAPMDPEIINGIQSFGLTFLQGYGLTETSPVVSTNTFFVNVPGTIGIPIKDIEVTIDEPDDDGMGELLVRGDNVMLGYYKNPEETQDVMEKDGWLRTGDLGIIDENGLIKITGRAKSMIVFTNGKKAFPEEYEMLLNSLPGIRDSYVWGYRAPDGMLRYAPNLLLTGNILMKTAFLSKVLPIRWMSRLEKLIKTCQNTRLYATLCYPSRIL